MRLLLIADIHGNYEALQTVLEIPHDRAICLGDIVDYGPDPDKCIDLLRKKAIPTIRGNHDNAVAFKVDCQCGYKYKHLSIATREYTWKVLDRDRMEYLQKLPLLIKEEIDGKKTLPDSCKSPFHVRIHKTRNSGRGNSEYDK